MNNEITNSVYKENADLKECLAEYRSLIALLLEQFDLPPALEYMIRDGQKKAEGKLKKKV